MRLRRETGDFSLNMEVGPGAAEYRQQLPKGLSAEDFVGVLVNQSMTVVPEGSDTPVTTTITSVVSIVQTSTDNDNIRLLAIDGPFATYSPTTGIIESYKKNGGGNRGGNPSTNL